jgi:hypothetical protein
MKKRLLLVGIALLLIIAVLVVRAAPAVARCYVVRWSALDNIAPNLYVDPNMPESQRQVLLSSLPDAKARVATLYGEYTADPVIIAGHTMDVMKTYGENSYNWSGRTCLTPVASFIILGPKGVRSIDILAHELAHVELSVRIGHQNRDEIPNWFDEGLAVQFDDRYSEAEWRTRTDNGKLAPDVDQMDIIKYDDWLEYATAKHEVRRWLDIVGQEGFLELLEAIRDGNGFQETYHSIEQTRTK